MANFLAGSPFQGTYLIPGTNTPANGGQLFFYSNGTSTKLTVYKDDTTATPWSNPIVLDSGGNLPLGAMIWLQGGQTYTIKYCPSNDTDPPTSPYRTFDDITGMNDVSATTGAEWVVFSSSPTFVSGTSFTLTGDQTATFQVGRRIKTSNTGGTIYSTISSSVFGASTLVTIVNDSGTLDAGLSAVWYGLLEATNPSIPLVADNQPIRSGSLNRSKWLYVDVDAYVPASTAVTLYAQGTSVIVADIMDSPGQGQLRYTNATTLTLVPFNGNRLIVSSLPYYIPSAGVQVTNAGTVTSTTYYVYANVTSGAIALQLSTTSHATNSTNGVEVMSSDGTRSLVGMARVSSTGVFADSITQRFVRSWNNRQSIAMYASADPGTKTNTSYAELNTTLRLEFCCWSTEAWNYQVSGNMQLVTAGVTEITYLAVAVDNTTTAAVATQIYLQQNGTTYGTATPCATQAVRTTGDGYHFVTPINQVSGNTHSYLNFNSTLNLIG